VLVRDSAQQNSETEIDLFERQKANPSTYCRSIAQHFTARKINIYLGMNLFGGAKLEQFNELLLDVGQLGKVLVHSTAPDHKRQSA